MIFGVYQIGGIMNRLKKLIISAMAFLLLAGCSANRYDASFLATPANGMSTITISGEEFTEPYNLGGTGINEFCAAMNLIKKVVVLDESRIPEDKGYELLIYTRTGHTTMYINSPYICIGDNWYIVEDDESLFYLNMMVSIIQRGNVIQYE